MTPYLPGPDLVPAALADQYKPLPDINIVRHAGRYLALAEVDPPVEVTADLDTVGPYDFGGTIPGMCAHPRIDPLTGEMVLFRYNIEAPFLTWSVVGADGSVSTGPQVVDVDLPTMIHDFTITSSLSGPLRGSAGLRFRGPVLRWGHAGLEARVGDADRRGTPPRGRSRALDRDRGLLGVALRQRLRAHRPDRRDRGGGRLHRVEPAGPGRDGSHHRGGESGGPRPRRLHGGRRPLRRPTGRVLPHRRPTHRQPHRFFVATAKTGDLPVGEQNTLVRVDTQGLVGRTVGVRGVGLRRGGLRAGTGRGSRGRDRT